MPTGYQLFKKEIFQTVKTMHFNEYKLKEGETILSIVTSKCKEEWLALSDIQMQVYNNKAEKASIKQNKKKNKKIVKDPQLPQIETPPSYEQSVKEPIKEPVKEPIKEPVKVIPLKASSYKRKNIPKAVKEFVWKKYISETCLEGKCFIGCGTVIQINKFEAGHVIAVANGGENTIENLRPICSLCNKSMGVMNLNEFIKKFGFTPLEI